MIETHKIIINPFFLSEAEQINLHVLAEIQCQKVNRLKFDVSLKPQHITLIAPDPFKEIEPTLQNILEEVSRYFKVSIAEMKSKSQKREFAKPRQIYCAIAREKTDCRLWEIAGLINRDHATAFNAAKALGSYKYKFADGDTTWSDYLKIKSMFK